MGIAVALGAIVAGGLFFLAIGFRPDIDEAVKSVPFLFKFVVTLSLAVPAIGLCSRLARPGVPVRQWGYALAVPALLLALAVIAELAMTPSVHLGAQPHRLELALLPHSHSAARDRAARLSSLGASPRGTDAPGASGRRGRPCRKRHRGDVLRRELHRRRPALRGHLVSARHRDGGRGRLWHRLDQLEVVRGGRWTAPFSFRLTPLRGGLHPGKSRIEIGLEILGVLEPDLQAQARPAGIECRGGAVVLAIEGHDEALEPSPGISHRRRASAHRASPRPRLAAPDEARSRTSPRRRGNRVSRWRAPRMRAGPDAAPSSPRAVFSRKRAISSPARSCSSSRSRMVRKPRRGEIHVLRARRRSPWRRRPHAGAANSPHWRKRGRAGGRNGRRDISCRPRPRYRRRAHAAERRTASPRCCP